MHDAFTLAVHSMQGDMRRLDAISHNLANVATSGYRRTVHTGRAFADAMSGNAALPLDTAAGALRATGNATDLTLTGDGYFELATPAGPAYTRAGAFRRDAAGKLISLAGFPLQGVNGDIVLQPGAADIDAQGRVWQNGAQAGQIRVTQFSGKQGMQRTPDGLLRPKDGMRAGPAALPQIRSGYLENSNVAPLPEMVALNDTSRHFEAAQKLYQGYDEQLNLAIRSLAEF
ncbi:MAG TPA: flagellar hook basal-body protein [Burkholderiaceae bacterium]